MNTANKIKSVILGDRMTLDELVAIARFHATVEFSEAYKNRVNTARALVEKWTREKRVMYGITTGFGILCDKLISPEETSLLQKNVIEASATSIGEPYTIEQSRAVMVAVLQNLGSGYSGVRLEVLEMYREFLNRGLTPWAPREGSVGYLCTEAHLARTLYGAGKMYFRGCLTEASEALKLAGLEPITLESKEGLSLISGTASPTALASLALYDMQKAAKAADIIGAMTLEISRGQLPAFDERVSKVRPHRHQAETAANVRKLLSDSPFSASAQGHHLQDPLSLRGIPQLHGAAKKTLEDARVTLEVELNSCNDNPFVWPDISDPDILSSCNCDASYVGLAMDSGCIAATMLAKMSERRNTHMIDGNMSGYPWFLVRQPGLNCGMMVPQYSQAAILNDMKILSAPATVDSIPTCGNQEDYVSMGYNAAKKAVSVAEKLESVLAYELLSVFAAHQFMEEGVKPGKATEALLKEMALHIPALNKDMFFHPYICYLKEFIHSGEILSITEEAVGELL